MVQENYIKLFHKFLKKKTSLREMQQLTVWLKSKSGFSNWANSQWDSASPNINQDLKEKIFTSLQIKVTTKRYSLQTLRQFGRYTAAAVALVCITTLGVYQYTIRMVQQPDTLVFVDKGQKAKVTLPDGTLVWLNSDSQLTYGAYFNQSERTVQLQGEAYFEVAKDNKRLFTVQTGGLAVEALGTHFNVHAYAQEKELTVTLLEGKVGVYAANKKVILTPNQKAVWNQENHILQTENTPNTTNYTLWMQDQLVFNGRSLEEIGKELERIYNMRIIFQSENIKNHRFNGVLKNTNLNSILQVMSLTAPLMYHFKGDTIYINENQKTKKYYK